eukprot:gene16110-biopygen3745
MGAQKTARAQKRVRINARAGKRVRKKNSRAEKRARKKSRSFPRARLFCVRVFFARGDFRTRVVFPAGVFPCVRVLFSARVFVGACVVLLCQESESWRLPEKAVRLDAEFARRDAAAAAGPPPPKRRRRGPKLNLTGVRMMHKTVAIQNQCLWRMKCLRSLNASGISEFEGKHILLDWGLAR